MSYCILILADTVQPVLRAFEMLSKVNLLEVLILVSASQNFLKFTVSEFQFLNLHL